MIKKSILFVLFSFLLITNSWSADVQMRYSMPILSPLYSPPPYEFRDSWGITIRFRTTPDAIKKLVPSPLIPNSENNMSITIQRSFARGFGSYNECRLMIPVLFQDKMYNFCAYVISDQDIDNASGREIWGFPKKFGFVKTIEEDGVMSATVERGAIIVVRAAVELGQSTYPEMDNLPIVNLKIIPSVKENAPPDVMQLTSMNLKGLKFNRIITGAATLDFGASPVDPLYKIPIKEVLEGFYTESDFTMSYGEVIYDYLKKK